MSPFKYYLSRSDKQAKARHSSTAHNGLESGLIEFVGVDTADGKEAMDAYVNASKKRKDQQDKQIKNPSTKLYDLESKVAPEPITMIYPDVRSPDSLEQTSSGAKITNTLEDKMDTVIDILNKLSAKIEHPKVGIPDVPTMLQENFMDKNDPDGNVDWSKIENIIDLTSQVTSVRFFAGQNGKKGCIRCQVCFEYHCSRDTGLMKCDPSETDDNGEAADKHIRKYITS